MLFDKVWTHLSAIKLIYLYLSQSKCYICPTFTPHLITFVLDSKCINILFVLETNVIFVFCTNVTNFIFRPHLSHISFQICFFVQWYNNWSILVTTEWKDAQLIDSNHNWMKIRTSDRSYNNWSILVTTEWKYAQLIDHITTDRF